MDESNVITPEQQTQIEALIAEMGTYYRFWFRDSPDPKKEDVLCYLVGPSGYKLINRGLLEWLARTDPAKLLRVIEKVRNIIVFLPIGKKPTPHETAED